MTTNSKLVIGTLISYQGAHSIDTAWVIEEPVPARTDGLVKIRVRGETGINADSEFDIYVKKNGRAKILEMKDVADATGNAVRRAKRAERELPTHDAGPYRHQSLVTGEPATGRVMTSHAECAHENSKAARAACRKARQAN